MSTLVRPLTWGHYAPTWAFDGSTYINLGGNLTGLSDGKQGLVSLWFWCDDAGGALKRILYTPDVGFAVQINASDELVIRAENTGGTTILRLTSSITICDGAWHHALAAWNLNTGYGELYIDDTDRLAGGATLTNDTIDYTRGDWTIGATEGGADIFIGELAQLYFDDAQRDITSASIRDDYVESDGDPVNFGEDGSNPSGGQPILFMLDWALDARVNRGSSDDFETVTGILTEGTVIPLASGSVPDEDDFNQHLGTNPLKLYEQLTDYDFLAMMRNDSATTVNNTTTLANVTDFSFAVKASETWVMIAFLRGTTTAAADWRFDLSTPSGSAGRQTVLGTQAEAPSTALGTDVVLNTSTANEAPLVYYAVIRTGSASGTVQLQVAQASADANDTTIENGSFGMAVRIASPAALKSNFWTDPRTWRSRELTLAALLNLNLRNNQYAMLNGELGFLKVVRLSSDHTVSSSTTPANISGFSFEVDVLSTWTWIILGHAASNTTADYRLQATVPSGATGKHYVKSSMDDGDADDIGTDVILPAPSANDHCLVYGGTVEVSSTAGTVQLQMAQSVSDGVTTTLYTDSVLVAYRTS